MSEFTKRLNLSKPEDGNKSWGNEIRGNFDTIDSVLGGRHFSERSSGHVGLVFAYHGGNLIIDNKFAEIPQGIVTLSDNSTNYVEAYIESGNVGRIVSNVNEFTKHRVPLFLVTTSSGTIAEVKDLRTWNKTVTVESVEQQLNNFQEQFSERIVGHHRDDLNNISLFGYYGGTISVDSKVAEIPDGQVALIVDVGRTNNVLNYIEAGFNSMGNPIVTANSTGFTEGFIPLFTANVSPTLTVDSVVDKRAWLSTVKNIKRFIDLTDTPTGYSNGKILKSTSNGIVFADESDNAEKIKGKSVKAPSAQDDQKFLAYDVETDSFIFLAGTDIANELDNRITQVEEELSDIQETIPDILALETQISDNTDALIQKGSTKRAVGFYIHDEIEVEQRALSFICPMNLEIVEIVLAIDEAPTGADLVIDVNKNGTTIYTQQANRPKIFDGKTNSIAIKPDIINLVENDKLSIDIDRVGSTSPGSNLIITIKCKEVN